MWRHVRGSWLVGLFVIVPGLAWSTTFYTNPDAIEILGTRIYNNGILNTGAGHGEAGAGHGIYGSYKNSLYDGVEVFHNGDMGMQVYAASGGIDHVTIRNSRFYGNGVAPNIRGGSGTGSVAYNNVIYGNDGSGIVLEGEAQRVYQNTVYGNADGGINVFRGSGHTIRNNIMYDNGRAYGNYANLRGGN